MVSQLLVEQQSVLTGMTAKPRIRVTDVILTKDAYAEVSSGDKLVGKTRNNQMLSSSRLFYG